MGTTNDTRTEEVDPAIKFALHFHDETGPTQRRMPFQESLSIMDGFSPDRDPFGLDPRVADGQVSKLHEYVQAGLVLGFSSQLSWRVWQKVDGNSEDDGWC